MNAFETGRVTQARTEQAPDGSSVLPLLSLPSGGMAVFELPAGQVSRAVRHRSVDEIWLVLAGTGAMWRKLEAQEDIVALEEGVCISIPAGTAFQFRCDGNASLRIVATTMPPWPGEGEAEFVPGKWD